MAQYKLIHCNINGKDVEKWEQVKIYGYLIRAIDD